jgi:hypothetical protein
MAAALTARSLARLRAGAQQFDDAGRAAAAVALRELSRCRLRAGPLLGEYHALLLFLLAHPGEPALRQRTESELARIGRFVKALPGRAREVLVNEGLPHADTVARFSHDAVRQLLRHQALEVRLEPIGQPRLDLNTVLRLTLPAAEWSATTAGLADDDLLAMLGVPPARRLAFLVAQLARLDEVPFVKDHFFDALDVHVRLAPRSASFSKARNRLPMPAVVYQRDRVKRFDARGLMNRPLPPPRALDGPAAQVKLAATVRDTLTLTCRETDPGTYLDLGSLRLFDLERGISVALYGMVPARQLPYESYVGFMLFKNGLGAAYGGAWVFGARAEFGMNIFEPYRGGESGFMMCQVLRVYRQVFGVRRFEVDAHQFGLDNPDGIASGAFWFYHRHGFRPVDRALARRAEREAARLAAAPGARSSQRTLRAFTGSSVALHFGGAVPPALTALTARITAMIARGHRGDRQAAEEAALARLASLGCRLRTPALPGAGRAAAEWALMAAVLRVQGAPRLALLRRLVAAKARDVYAYQASLLRFLGAESSG